MQQRIIGLRTRNRIMSMGQDITPGDAEPAAQEAVPPPPEPVAGGGCTDPWYERGAQGECVQRRECFNPDGSLASSGTSQVDDSFCGAPAPAPGDDIVPEHPTLPGDPLPGDDTIKPGDEVTIPPTPPGGVPIQPPDGGALPPIIVAPPPGGELPGGGFTLPDGTEAAIDPTSGFPFDPETGIVYDPVTGEATDFVFDPETGLIMNPTTGQAVDPMTGLPYDPATGQILDPATGEPTGYIYDPQTGQILDAETGEPIDPVTLDLLMSKLTPDLTGRLAAAGGLGVGLIAALAATGAFQ